MEFAVRRRNPAGIELVDGAILIGAGAVLGVLAYWAYTKYAASSDSGSAASAPQYTGTDSSGNPTYASVSPSGVATFQNTTPGALGPAVGG